MSQPSAATSSARAARTPGAAATAYLAYKVVFAVWSLGLLLYGVRTTYGWSWLRSVGALGLLVGFLAVFGLIAAVL